MTRFTSPKCFGKVLNKNDLQQNFRNFSEQLFFKTCLFTRIQFSEWGDVELELISPLTDCPLNRAFQVKQNPDRKKIVDPSINK